MRILLIASYLPFPLHSGGHIRLYNLMKQLQDVHEITLICEKRSQQTDEDIAEVNKICKKVITVPRKQQWSAATILKTGFSLDPFLISGHRSLEMKQQISRELEHGQYDVIHVETFYIYQNLPTTTLPVILVEHNVEYLVYQRYAESASLFLRPLLAIDINKLKRIEERTWQKATKVVAVSEKEKKIMQKFAKHVALVRNGVDTNVFTFHDIANDFEKKKKKLLFIGDFKWIQNVAAASWILQHVFPIVKEHMKDVVFWIVGKNIPEKLKRVNSDEHIFFDEHNTMTTSQIFQEASVLVTPIRIGGGTSYKILEAMATGRPVITTKLGNEGIQAKENEEILIGETAGEIAEKVMNVLTDKKLYQQIAKNARVHIEKIYSWDSIAKELDAVYQSVKHI